MTFGANIYLNFRFGGTDIKTVPASAGHFGIWIPFGMNIVFHEGNCTINLWIFPEALLG